MNLSIKLIIKHLEQSYSLQTAQNLSTALVLGRPVFLTDQPHWPQGHICICNEVPEHLENEPLPEDILVLFTSCSAHDLHTVSNRMFELPD